MSVFSLVQKRAYLQAALARPIPFPQGRMQCPQFSELHSLTPAERKRSLESLSETQLDELISAHIRSLTQRIAHRFLAEAHEAQTA
jgi:hypothetical protein